MNEIIAKKLDDQLRVLDIFLHEYEDKLYYEILGDRTYLTLRNLIETSRRKCDDWI